MNDTPHNPDCIAGVILTGVNETEKITRCERCGMYATDEAANEAVQQLRLRDRKRPRNVGFVRLPNDCFEILLRYQSENGEGRSLEQITESLLGGALITWAEKHPE